jgi:hypothetical protein
MRQALAPTLFDDDNPVAAEAAWLSVVAPASVPAQRHASPNLPQMKTPLHNFHALFSERAPVAKHRLLPKTKDSVPFATASPLPPVAATRLLSARSELSNVAGEAYAFFLIS